MKFILLNFLILSGTLLFSQSEVKNPISNNSESVFYIFDESWPPYNSNRIKTDESPNYIQIQGEKAVVSGRYGYESVFINGVIENYKVSIQGTDNLTKFVILGSGESKGKKIQVEIIESVEGDLTVHLFETLGTFNRYFSARPSTSEEEDKIEQYWDKY